MGFLRVGLAQINTTVGDLEGNRQKILKYIAKAKRMEVDLLAFPELAITGYPPEDLLFKRSFIQANLESLQQIAQSSEDIIVVVGFVDQDQNQSIYNAAAIICDGKIASVYHKMYLPNYGVFDEQRYFQAGRKHPVFCLGDRRFGINICEDIWYPEGPASVQAFWGDARLIVNIAASPYHVGKAAERERMLATRALDNMAIVAFCNLVGGQDELVFDGRSAIFNERGELIAQGKAFAEDIVVADLNLRSVLNLRLHDPRRRYEKSRQNEFPVQQIELVLPQKESHKSKVKSLKPKDFRLSTETEAEVYAALVVGTRDYVQKNGFEKVIVGLSGGLDSSLVACIAVDALGKENVIGAFMPSPYSSKESRLDAERLAQNLGIKLLTIDIDKVYQAYLEMLKPLFEKTKPDATEENIQARIRGNMLMALSNKFGWLVLATGNKSELSLGYATLYGDMAGGFAPLKDVPKTMVYELAKWRNSKDKIIPQRVFTKPPSAELRPQQKDEEDLPAPYKVLDPIIKAYVEEDKSILEIAQLGFERELVRKVCHLIDRNEYKRRQSPVGIKITPRAFGKDRRLPITNKFREL